MPITRTQSTVPESAGSGRIGEERPPIEEQFRELAEMFRERARRTPNSPYWFQTLIDNVWRYSPKCRCWLIRESFSELSECFREDWDVKKQEATPENDKGVPMWGFVNVTLSDEQREAAHLDYGDGDTMWDSLVTILRDGYKVTLSYDAETDSYCAALSGTNCGKPNERLTLTAWGAGEVEALQYVIYKHVVVLEFVWQRPGQKPKRLG